MNQILNITPFIAGFVYEVSVGVRIGLQTPIFVRKQSMNQIIDVCPPWLSFLLFLGLVSCVEMNQFFLPLPFRNYRRLFFHMILMKSMRFQDSAGWSVTRLI